MNLSNPIVVVVYYVLIRGVTCFGRWDKFPIMSVLMCMVTHWIGPTVNHNIRLSNCHDSQANNYMDSQP